MQVCRLVLRYLCCFPTSWKEYDYVSSTSVISQNEVLLSGVCPSGDLVIVLSLGGANLIWCSLDDKQQHDPLYPHSTCLLEPEIYPVTGSLLHAFDRFLTTLDIRTPSSLPNKDVKCRNDVTMALIATYVALPWPGASSSLSRVRDLQVLGFHTPQLIFSIHWFQSSTIIFARNSIQTGLS